VPKSKVRKKTDQPARNPSLASAGRGMSPSPAWYPVVMAVVLLLGLAYIVVWYLAPDNPLMSGIGAWNLAIGFAVMVVGLVMAVRWR
jgi:membrane protein YdbS with pleckstrin-like domain